MFCLILLASLAVSALGQTCSTGGQIYELGIDTKGKETVLNAHNTYRRYAAEGKIPNQPRATNMKMLKYDNILGDKGRVVSNTCQMKHIIATDGRWFWVGQNLYMVSSTAKLTGQNWQAAVNAWYNEYKDFTYPNTAAPGKMVGHYTQVVWAETEYVGCDYVAFYKPGTAFPYSQLYTCNYGVGGNVNNNAPYLK